MSDKPINAFPGDTVTLEINLPRTLAIRHDEPNDCWVIAGMDQEVRLSCSPLPLVVEPSHAGSLPTRTAEKEELG